MPPTAPAKDSTDRITGVKQIRQFDFKIKAIDEEQRTFTAIASDDSIDRYGESINQEGWDLANYKKNPVGLWAHQYGMPPVFKTIDIGIVNGNLQFTAQFPTPEEYAFADTIYKLYIGGYLRAFSVGFIPNKWTEDDEGAFTWEQMELLEISSVPVPANANALAMAFKEGVIDDAQRKDLVNHLTQAKKELVEAERRIKVKDALSLMRTDISKIGQQLDVLTNGLDTNEEGSPMPQPAKKSTDAPAISIKSETVGEVSKIEIEGPAKDLAGAVDALSKALKKDGEGGDAPAGDDTPADGEGDEQPGNDDEGSGDADPGEAKPEDEGKSADGADQEEVDPENLSDDQAERISRAVADNLAKKAGKVD